VNKLGEFKINIMYNEFIIMVIIVDIFVKFKFFSLDTSLEKYRKIINNPLIMMIRKVKRGIRFSLLY